MTIFPIAILRRPISIAQVDRLSVRAIVKDDVAYLNRAIAAGHDVQQVRLQGREQIDQFVQTLGPTEAMAFLNLYQEEVSGVHKQVAIRHKSQNAVVARGRALSFLVTGFATLSIFFAAALFPIIKYFC